jgi:hypothetical protein
MDEFAGYLTTEGQESDIKLNFKYTYFIIVKDKKLTVGTMIHLSHCTSVNLAPIQVSIIVPHKQKPTNNEFQ